MLDYIGTSPNLRPILDDGRRQSAIASSANAELEQWPVATDKRDLGERQIANKPRRHDPSVNRDLGSAASMNLADFVEHKFVPEYVVLRKAAGREHFYGILKHILTPARVDQAFHVSGHTSKTRLEQRDLWPYLDSLPLLDVTTERIQHLISVALDHGYSVQTVTHIRNVLRSIFVHAAKAASFEGKNAARFVTLPAMARREVRCLTLDELWQVMRHLRYPARELALFAVLTDMNIAEICGLKWKYVNLSRDARRLDRAWLPPMTITVRMQSYRARLSPVSKCRERNVAIPDLLSSVLGELRQREKFTGPEDFVLASHAGTPISQDNLAHQQLTKLRTALGLPWLSWHVFHRAHLELATKLDKRLEDKLKRAMLTEIVLSCTLQKSVRPPSSPMPKEHAGKFHEQQKRNNQWDTDPGQTWRRVL
jgi:integrase